MLHKNVAVSMLSNQDIAKIEAGMNYCSTVKVNLLLCDNKLLVIWVVGQVVWFLPNN
jgi:hypothetical protein